MSTNRGPSRGGDHENLLAHSTCDVTHQFTCPPPCSPRPPPPHPAPLERAPVPVPPRLPPAPPCPLPPARRAARAKTAAATTTTTTTALGGTGFAAPAGGRCPPVNSRVTFVAPRSPLVDASNTAPRAEVRRSQHRRCQRRGLAYVIVARSSFSLPSRTRPPRHSGACSTPMAPMTRQPSAVGRTRVWTAPMPRTLGTCPSTSLRRCR